MSNRDEFIRRMQEKLGEWNGEIDRLTARAGEASAEARKEIDEQIVSQKAKQAEARQKIDELQHAGESALDDLKSGIELALTAMGEAIHSARSRFK